MIFSWWQPFIKCSDKLTIKVPKIHKFHLKIYRVISMHQVKDLCYYWIAFWLFELSSSFSRFFSVTLVEIVCSCSLWQGMQCKCMMLSTREDHSITMLCTVRRRIGCTCPIFISVRRDDSIGKWSNAIPKTVRQIVQSRNGRPKIEREREMWRYRAWIRINKMISVTTVWPPWTRFAVILWPNCIGTIW